MRFAFVVSEFKDVGFGAIGFGDLDQVGACFHREGVGCDVEIVFRPCAEAGANGLSVDRDGVCGLDAEAVDGEGLCARSENIGCGVGDHRGDFGDHAESERRGLLAVWVGKHHLIEPKVQASGVDEHGEFCGGFVEGGDDLEVGGQDVSTIGEVGAFDGDGDL